MNLSQHHEFFLRLCCDLDVKVDRETLAQHFPSDVVAHWLSLPERRKTIYRDLVFHTVHDIIVYVFQDTTRFLGNNFLIGATRDFLAQHKIKSCHFYNIPRDFWDWAQNSQLFIKTGVACLPDLADYEFSRWDLYQKSNSISETSLPKDLPLENARIIFNPDIILKTYRWPVLDVKNFATQSDFLKSEGCVNLLLYRHPDDRLVQTFSLNESAFVFLELALQNPNDSVGALFEKLLATLNQSESIVQDLCAFMAQLLQNKIIQGYAASSHT